VVIYSRLIDQAAPTSRRGASSQSRVEDVIEVPNTVLHPSDTTKSSNITRQCSSTSAKTLNEVPTSMQAPVINAGLHTAATSIDIVGPMTRSRSRSRTRSASADAPAPNVPHAQKSIPASAGRPKAYVTTSTPTPTPSTQPIKIPRLHQGTSSYKTYLDRANAMFLSLPSPKDQELEIEFIALFIKGMRDEDKREVLVGELQQQHQSRTKKDGKVEILCKWKDVEGGMKSVGLIAIINVSSGLKEKHRSKFLNELKGLES
jgi:hypothetical protein